MCIGRIPNLTNRLLVDNPDYNLWYQFFGCELFDAYVNQNQTINVSGNFYIESSVFANFSDRGVVEVLNTHKGIVKLLTSRSTFISPFRAACGGSIFFVNEGESIQYKICCFEGKASHDEIGGAHSAIYLTTKSYILFSSFAKSYGGSSVLIDSGKDTFYSSINISHSSFMTNSIYDMQSHSSVNLSNFCNQTSYRSFISYNSLNNIMNSCNIIRSITIDDSDLSEYEKHIIYDYYNPGLISLGQGNNLSIRSCVFKENVNEYLFWVKYEAKIFVYDCQIEEDNMFMNICNDEDNVGIENSKSLSVYQYRYLSTVFCEAERSLMSNDGIQINHRCKIMSPKMKILFPFHSIFNKGNEKSKRISHSNNKTQPNNKNKIK